MKVTLYTTGCPKCKVLESKLEKKNISFTKEEDVQKLINLGYRSAPVLEADGILMTFEDANVWINSYGD